MFTGGGSTWAGTPPGQVHPPGRSHPPGRYHLSRYTPLGKYTPRQVYPRVGTPPGRYTPWQLPPWVGTPPGQVPPEQVHPPGSYTPLGRYTPVGRYTPSPGQVHPLPWAGTPTQEQCMLGDTGNKRGVRILLECILVTVQIQTCYLVNSYLD